MWIDVWGINQVNEKFHELVTGCLRKFYGPGIVNDPHILKIGIKLVLYPVLASNCWKVINLSKVFVTPEDLMMKKSTELKVRIKPKKNTCHQRY